MENFPMPFENSTMWKNVELIWSGVGQPAASSSEDIALTMASSGYYLCMSSTTCQGQSMESKAALNNLLNNAPASFPGVMLRFKNRGTYYYISTRNNNFTNRSQKGVIRII